MQLHEFLIFFQKSGSYMKLRTRSIHFARENTARGAATGWQSLATFGNLFSSISTDLETRSRIWPTCHQKKNDEAIGLNHIISIEKPSSNNFNGQETHFCEMPHQSHGPLGLTNLFPRCASLTHVASVLPQA